jgi:hypothetical protein
VERERRLLADTLDALQIQPQLYSGTIPLGQAGPHAVPALEI